MKTIQYALYGGKDDHIQLIQLLKATNCVETGAEAQIVVVEGLVKRNGEIEFRKRAKCVVGDVIEFDAFRIEITDNN